LLIARVEALPRLIARRLVTDPDGPERLRNVRAKQNNGVPELAEPL
jgi:hypothetical protein